MKNLTSTAISIAKRAAEQARFDAKAAAARYKAQPVEGYQPEFKRLHKLYPTKNYALED